jgi:hypothetical protein
MSSDSKSMLHGDDEHLAFCTNESADTWHDELRCMYTKEQ